MVLKLPRLRVETPISGQDGKPTREVTRYWDEHCTLLEEAINGLVSASSQTISVQAALDDLASRVAEAEDKTSQADTPRPDELILKVAPPENSLTASSIRFSQTQRVLGRNSAGAGDGEEVSLTQLLDWVGSAAQGDIIYRGASTWTRLAAGTSGYVLTTNGAAANPSWNAGSVAAGAGTPGARTVPGGRPTLTTGTPVLTANVTGASTIYYTPDQTDLIPIYDGTQWVVYSFAEISQTLSDTTKQPAAIGSYAAFDGFVWNDSGTLRLSLISFSRAQTVTVTIASPAVFTITGHSFYEGMPVVFTTTGALPTGLTAGTTYFVMGVNSGLTADNFRVATSLANVIAGTAVNTSGTQSGAHTATEKFTAAARGTGAGTSELQLLNGIYTNKNAITNGPAANRGTYVLTGMTDGSTQVNMKFGGTGASGGEGTVLGLWSPYNQVDYALNNHDNADTVNYTIQTWQIKNSNEANRIQFVIGLQQHAIQALNSIGSNNSSAGIPRAASVGYNSMSAYDVGRAAVSWADHPTGGRGMWHTAPLVRQLPVGAGYIAPVYISQASGTCTWYGDNGANGSGTGFVLAGVFQATIRG